MNRNPKIFVVTNTREKTKRLIRALTKATARRFASEGDFIAHAATQDDVAELMARGVQVENAKAPD